MEYSIVGLSGRLWWWCCCSFYEQGGFRFTTVQFYVSRWHPTAYEFSKVEASGFDTYLFTLLQCASTIFQSAVTAGQQKRKSFPGQLQYAKIALQVRSCPFCCLFCLCVVFPWPAVALQRFKLKNNSRPQPRAGIGDWVIPQRWKCQHYLRNLTN